MILQPCNVELTKIHYYANQNNRNANIVPSISREIADNHHNCNIIIKNNIFGHRWVLKINEANECDIKKASNIKLILYVFVFSCIIIAVGFGVYFSLDNHFKQYKTTTNIFKHRKTHEDIRAISAINLASENRTKIIILRNSNSRNIATTTIIPPINPSEIPALIKRNQICGNCTLSNICLKRHEMEKPKCYTALDINDPTGCGGLCTINTQFCKLLDAKSRIYQCTPIHSLHCPDETFNCGNMCISKKYQCDGMIHCSNQSDERHCDCDLETHFQCGNSTSCLKKSRRCDGKVDCWDKSDEQDCNRNCMNNEMSCLNGECIAKDAFCDGSFHCSDHSDEPKGC